MTFLSFIFVDDRSEIEGTDMEKYNGKFISESELDRNYMNCLFIFIMQIGLAGISVYYNANDIGGIIKKDQNDIN